MSDDAECVTSVLFVFHTFLHSMFSTVGSSYSPKSSEIFKVAQGMQKVMLFADDILDECLFRNAEEQKHKLPRFVTSPSPSPCFDYVADV
jgi:hypothetical protein